MSDRDTLIRPFLIVVVVAAAIGVFVLIPGGDSPGDSNTGSPSDNQAKSPSTSGGASQYSSAVNIDEGTLYAPQIPDQFSLQSTGNTTAVITNAPTPTSAYSTRFVRENVSASADVTAIQTTAARYGSPDTAETALRNTVEEHDAAFNETTAGGSASIEYHLFSYENENGYTTTVRLRRDSNVVHGVIVTGEGSQSELGHQLLSTQATQITQLNDSDF